MSCFRFHFSARERACSVRPLGCDAGGPRPTGRYIDMLWDMDQAPQDPELEWRARRLIGIMTDSWLSLGSINWSQRDIRRVERRGREINIRRWWSPSDGNEPFGWEQWGVGSRTRWPRWDGDNPYGY